MRGTALQPSEKIAITIDLEDYHWQFYRRTGRQMDDLSDCFSDDVEKIIDFFSDNSIKITFFTAGYVAQKKAQIIKKIHNLGHEIACHGLFHDLIFEQSEKQFGEELRIAKDKIEQVIGENIYGFRAPAFSVSRKTPWFFEMLALRGFHYDSSIRISNLHIFKNKWPIKIKVGDKFIWEFPFKSLGYGFKRLTIIGGSYLRVLPAKLIRYLIARSMKDCFTPIVYIHPYDCQYPVVGVKMDHLSVNDKIKFFLGNELRTWGRKSTLYKLKYLISNFELSNLTFKNMVPADCGQDHWSESEIFSVI